MSPIVTLDDWQQRLGRIYAQSNAFLSAEATWLRVVEEAGQLAESIRKTRRPAAAVERLPHLLAWVLAFANETGMSLAEVSWHKYPSCCPYCVQQQPDYGSYLSGTYQEMETAGRFFGALHRCTCGPEYEKFDPATLDGLRARAERRPATLSDWQDMFGVIYTDHHAANTDSPVRDIMFHLMEEINEVAFEIRRGHYEDCRDEVADVFSWIIGLAECAGRPRGQFERDFAAAYPDRCLTCGHDVCLCWRRALRG